MIITSLSICFRSEPVVDAKFYCLILLLLKGAYGILVDYSSCTGLFTYEAMDGSLTINFCTGVILLV